MNKYDPKIHHRRSIRLPGYDYRGNGAYFLTICVEKKRCLLGHVLNDQIHLNTYGDIVEEEWLLSAQIRSEIHLDDYVIMPNHFHAIVWIAQEEGVLPYAPTSDTLTRRPRSLSTLVSGFKGAVSRRINKLHSDKINRFWQRNYYEHIIRTEESLDYIRYYVKTNPQNWQKDSLYEA